jgi:hypothetical protein
MGNSARDDEAKIASGRVNRVGLGYLDAVALGDIVHGAPLGAAARRRGLGPRGARIDDLRRRRL